jgi:hypothetical protein
MNPGRVKKKINRVVMSRVLRTYHQNEIGPLGQCVGYPELVKYADKYVTSLLVLLQLSFEESALGCLF